MDNKQFFFKFKKSSLSSNNPDDTEHTANVSKNLFYMRKTSNVKSKEKRFFNYCLQL